MFETVKTPDFASTIKTLGGFLQTLAHVGVIPWKGSALSVAATGAGPLSHPQSPPSTNANCRPSGSAAKSPPTHRTTNSR
ncbi:hypothetical protein DDF84_031270 [Cupriavidus metallidurans]|uniref:Uncharacterized protein n=1 Tax=Cupriavidus metallidurans TaxID=119219 RepID=A0A482J4M5_9BURK|nr:hypothetical protein DDF84_031270 [Cupriavidus metallidurans]HBD38530.1 hypothetical protein [Cupriavidus sp.]HBO81232.1 hypothetical protein [Cupriavidus sp.]